MIKLKFYRLLPETHTLGGDDQPDVDCSYTPYQVFILESRLYPLIFNMFEGKNLEIYLKSEHNSEQNRMDLYLTIEEIVNPHCENELVNLTEQQREIIQKKIYEITSTHINYALIDMKELYNSINVFVSRKDVKNSTYTVSTYIPKFSFTWFSKVIEYTGLNSSFNPFIRPEGIYLAFNPVSDYKTAYYEVCDFLVQRVLEFYNDGVIILDDIIDSKLKGQFVKDWKLVPQDSEEIQPRIYKPDWIDSRFARNRVEFLTRKIEGDPYIKLRISDNLVDRHGIAKALQKENKAMIMEGSYLKVEATSLQDAQRIASIVFSTKTFGRVLVISVSRMSEIYLYFEYAEKKYGKKAVSYSVDSVENPYIFSVLLPEDEYESYDRLRIEFRDYVLDRLIEVSKISKLKSMSPHDIIMQEY